MTLGTSEIPIYPHFRKLRLADKTHIETFLSQFEPYCDFRFWAMWHRDLEQIWKVSQLHDHMLVEFVDHITGNSLFSVIGSNDRTGEVLIAMLSLLSNHTLSPKLSMVPHETVEAIPETQKGQFVISLDKANSDYVYAVKQLAELKGNKMKSKRRQVQGFWERYPSAIIRKLNLHSTRDTDMMMSLTHIWSKQSKKMNREREILTVSRLLNTKENKDDLHALGIMVGSKLIGFTINEPFGTKWYSAYFGKADPRFHGAFSVLEHETAKDFIHMGFEYANLEQDLGLPGLRRTKQLWRPIRMLNKYTIKPRWSNGIDQTKIWRANSNHYSLLV